MIIKRNYLYTNTTTKETALGGDDELLIGDPSTILLQFLSRNGGKVIDKYVDVLSDEWDATPKNLI